MQQQLADPAVNVPAGARYLSYLMDLFPGRLDLVLAAYNAGEGAVQKFGKAIPPYKETMNYVKAVTGIYEQLQAARPLSGRLAAAGSAGRGGSRIRMTLPGAALRPRTRKYLESPDRRNLENHKEFMSDQTTLDLSQQAAGDALDLGQYAQRAYLEYALSVVKGRALPDVSDGLKPVQRRILYAMDRMGLGYSGPNGNTAAKPVKSARVVGDVLGRFHPHGDQSAYDALVRMAQDFNQRYPLVDGQGNFGSRDGDGAAAMRYTEARLSKITGLLLDEIDMGTVDFVPNYDGSTRSPSSCRRACRSRCSMAPAALPWVWPRKSPATICPRWPRPAWP
jgi:hypothetical protein